MRNMIYLMIAVLLVSSVWGAGLGISPSIVTIEDMLRGNAYDKYFKVLNLEEFDKNATINITGEAASWITLKDIDTKETLPKVLLIPGKSDYSFIAKFDIPADAPNGLYEGYIEIRPTSKTDVEGSLVSLVVRGFYRIYVTGNEIRQGIVESITAQDTESGQPLRIYYDFRNTGNIALAPRAEVVVSKDAAIIDTFSQEGEMVHSGTHLAQEVTWDSENRGTGMFEADVSVYLDENLLATKKLAFNLSARGTLTAEAFIGEISKPDKLNVKDIGKAQVKFFNVGKIDVLAKLTGEVYRDGKIVDVVSGDEILVKAGKSDDLSFYYKPESEGKYTIKSKVLFAGKEEPLEDIVIDVISEEKSFINKQEFGTDNGAVGLLTGLVVVLIIAVVVMGYLYMRKDRKIKIRRR